jgi:hypothetical protein
MLTSLKIFGVAAVIAIALFIVIQSGAVDINNTIPSHNTYSTPPTENKQKNEILRPAGLEYELIKAGWESNAAHAVVALNNEWFTIIKPDRPLELEKQIYLLKNLGHYSHLMPLFESHPETASLLAAANDPERLAQLFQNDDCYDIITGLFVQHAAPEDAAALANALEIHRSLICRLVKRGLIGSQALFIFPRDNAGAQEYDRWLSEVLDVQSEDKLSSVINLLFEQGTDIRVKMIDDGHFRYAFRNDLWPKFLRVTHKTQLPFELYLSDPHLWDLLALPQGERLLEQWLWFLSLEQINNLTPAAVLFGDEAYPDPLHPFIIEAILENDANRLVSLLYFGHEPLFVKLMQRDLSDDIKQQAFKILVAQGLNYPATLEDWDKASDADLHYELVNADSGTFHTFKKVVQGREVSGGEAFWVVADIADLAITVATLGTGTLVSSGLKLGAKKVAKSALKQQAKKLVKQNVGKAVAKNASETLLVSFAKKEFLQKMQRLLSKVDEKLSMSTFNITPILQFLFKKMNVNRTTLKRINKKWDARLFMRKDAKVLVQVDHKELASGACLFFEMTSATGVKGDVGEKVACGLEKGLENAKAIVQLMKNSLESLSKQQRKFKAWQKNTSAWWLMNASH